ncbi:inosine 5-monophosphate dehydrogenase [Candidatus Desantisbacteria bacterium CG2_30_40_21]|uniref:GuaB3 family IMP dehydrogenase-related protein n=5 Tax=unclassified Candidatus Desantisiibacteriota TaxID=3106372 RepID=A0A2M7J8I1_9BACT
MGAWIGRGRKARTCYGFDDIAIVPGCVSIDPEDVDTTWMLGNLKFDIPILASAMDGVVDVHFAIAMSRLGGVAVLNLEGIQTRYDDPSEALANIVKVSPDEATNVLQKIYEEPVKKELVIKRIKEIKDGGGVAAVSIIPQRIAEFGPIAQEAGADILVIQATVVTAKFISKANPSLDFKELKKKISIPVIVGNCVTYESALELMETGIDGLLVGVGPGSACTTRGVLGIGVPQVSATVDCAAARDFYYKQTGRYVSIITDGGMSVGGDVCKAFASGADAVMIGSAFAKTEESPGKGYHWGMATPHRNLPRGTRIFVGTTSTLETILYGPAHLDDGSQNLVGALRTAMGVCGADTVRQMQLVELVIAPSIKTEGKIFQKTQRIGMGK